MQVPVSTFQQHIASSGSENRQHASLQRWAITTFVTIVTPLDESLLAVLNHAAALDRRPTEIGFQAKETPEQRHAQGQPDHNIIKGFNALLVDSVTLWDLGGCTVIRLSEGIIVKIAQDLDIDHLEILRAIERHAPGLCIPRPLGTFRTARLSYYFQTYVDGSPLSSVWPSLHTRDKSSIRDQLDNIFRTIRKVPMAGSDKGRRNLGSGDPRRCKDMRRHVRIADCAIEDEASFNQFLTAIDPEASKPNLLQRRDMVRSMMSSDHDIVLTHADLHPRNIIVAWVPAPPPQAHDDNAVETSLPYLKIMGIIDWELAGWYPAYWEYVKALHTISATDSTLDWWKYLPDSIGSWGAEFAIDLMISRWFR